MLGLKLNHVSKRGPRACYVHRSNLPLPPIHEDPVKLFTEFLWHTTCAIVWGPNTVQKGKSSYFPLHYAELRTQNSEFYLTILRTHRRGHRFINASRFSNGWYWNKAGEYSLTKLTKKYSLQRLNKEMMPYLVGVMLSGVPLRHLAAIIGPLQQYNLNEKETDVAENFRLYVCHTEVMMSLHIHSAIIKLNLWWCVVSRKCCHVACECHLMLKSLTVCDSFYSQGRLSYDGVMTSKSFSHHWPFVRGILQSPVASPTKGQWCAVVISLFMVRTCRWTTNRITYFRRHDAHVTSLKWFNVNVLMT